MKEYVPIIVSVVAGFLAMVSAFFAWKLKQSSESEIRAISKQDMRHSELKLLYIKINENFEALIKNTKLHSEENLNSKFSNLTAEVRMLASEHVVQMYLSVADLHHEWAALYFKAYPPVKNGILIIQSPDPTLKFKVPEKVAYESFYNEYQKLILAMRTELSGT